MSSFIIKTHAKPGRVAQLVMCQTADPGVTSSFPARFHTLVEIDYEMISTGTLLPSADSRRILISYMRKYGLRSTGKLLSQACPGKKCG